MEYKRRIGPSFLLWAVLARTSASISVGSTQGRQALAPKPIVLLEEGIEENLKVLRLALFAKDALSVMRITDELRQPFAGAVPQQVQEAIGGAQPASSDLPDAVKVAAGASQSAAAVPGQPTVAGVHEPKGATPAPEQCIFDDRIFSLTPAAKAELSTQLDDARMKEAVQWIRTGGWWNCATLNGVCTCAGNVHMVQGSRSLVGVTVNAANHGGKVQCAPGIFGAAASIKPNEDVQCECNIGGLQGLAGEADAFHLEKRLSSTSILQESWVALLRLLGRTGLLPLGTGDKTYSGIQNWARRATPDMMGSGMNVVPERFWIEKFVREIATPKVQGPKCLEWGDPQRPGQFFNYAMRVPSCTQNFDLQFDKVYWDKHGMHVAGNIIYSDILSLPKVLGPGNQMNAIFATQVFEHLASPLHAARALFEATAPGGVVVFTGPQQAQFHKVPHDYYRYTPEGVKFTFIQAGFCVPNSDFAGGGDFIFDIGRDAGLQLQDYPMEEVEAAYQVGFDKVSHSAVGIHCLAFKPPHAACDDPTSGWAELARQGIKA